MENRTVVSAQSLSTDENAGDAGTVTVNAGNQFLMNNSTITTESTNAGGGRVEINAADGFMVQLINSGIKTSVFGGSDTTGGNITIDPQFVMLQNSQILAQAFAGAGGAINITQHLPSSRILSVSLTHRLHTASAGPSISSRRCRMSVES